MISTQEHQSLNTKRHLSPPEIQAHLEGVEYIIMAAPATRNDRKAPIHFTIFLNTTERLPEEVQTTVLEKFAKQYKITNIEDLFSQLDGVAFSMTTQDTPMPLHLFKQEDKRALPHTIMHIIDFEGDSNEFKEAKEQDLTGWSYSYN